MTYADFIAKMGLTQAQMDAAAAAMPEPFPKGASEPYAVEPSPIHGVGVFATAPIVSGDDIALFNTGSGWTEAGRYANHSDDPTGSVYMDGTRMRLRAARDVPQSQEITVDYQQVYETLTNEAEHHV